VILQVYDSNKEPSCYKNVANFVIPGYITIASVTINVTKQLNLMGNSKQPITLQKNDPFMKYICKNGKSMHPVISDKVCTSNFCNDGADKFCKLIENRGVYNLDDIKNAVDLDDLTFYIDDHAHGVTHFIYEGQWKADLKLQSGDETVAYVKGPSETSWLWVDE
jgi:hypothetical protein